MDGLCMYFGIQVCATMLVGKICFYWMLQHVDFRQFMGSLADFTWFCGLMHVCVIMHVCVRILPSVTSFRCLELENCVFDVMLFYNNGFNVIWRFQFARLSHRNLHTATHEGFEMIACVVIWMSEFSFA